MPRYWVVVGVVGIALLSLGKWIDQLQHRVTALEAQVAQQQQAAHDQTAGWPPTVSSAEAPALFGPRTLTAEEARVLLTPPLPALPAGVATRDQQLALMVLVVGSALVLASLILWGPRR